jgi:hypothetical protein
MQIGLTNHTPAHVQNHGARERIRTADLLITSELLYRLSYPGEGLEKSSGRRPVAETLCGIARAPTQTVSAFEVRNLTFDFDSTTLCVNDGKVTDLAASSFLDRRRSRFG